MSIPCPPGMFSYMIRAGDTFYRLAIRFNTTVAAIMAANPNINPYNLQIGQSICIPGAAPAPDCPGTRYTIRAGDTLFRIAQTFNIPLASLIAANPGINPNLLRIGQVICVPTGAPSACPPGSTVYIIRAGDTFFRLARQFNVSVDALIQANPNANPNNLQIGQQICIPQARNVYTNTEYKVRFLYPANWRRINDLRYEGPGGFFQISAITSVDPLNTVCRNEAFAELMPYGSNPEIRGAIINFQPACFIFPSADQPPGMANQAALIVEYPTPVVIQGEEYNYFILWADKFHIEEIGFSLQFLQ